MTIGVLWFGVYNVALNAGERRVDAGTAAMLIQVSPVLVALLAAMFLDEQVHALPRARPRPRVRRRRPDRDGLRRPSGDRDVLGVLLCLVAAVVYSVSLVLQKPLVAELPAIHVTWLACTVGAVVCLPFVGQLVDDTRAAPGVVDVLVGRLPRRLPDRDRVHDVRLRAAHMTASSLGVTTYLVPPITIVMGWLFLGEAPPDDGVRRRRARPGRRRGRPPQAAHAGRRASAAPPECCHDLRR